MSDGMVTHMTTLPNGLIATAGSKFKWSDSDNDPDHFVHIYGADLTIIAVLNEKYRPNTQISSTHARHQLIAIRALASDEIATDFQDGRNSVWKPNIEAFIPRNQTPRALLPQEPIVVRELPNGEIAVDLPNGQNRLRRPSNEAFISPRRSFCRRHPRSTVDVAVAVLAIAVGALTY